MPTGYTAPIEDTETFTFEEYVWRCATGFGAFVMQRDSDLGTPRPREQMPDQWHERELAKARGELAALEAMPPEIAELHAADDYARQKKAHVEGAARQRAIYDRYKAMRAKAEAWTPPTPEHAGLRSFMMSQIDLCTEHMDPTGESYAPIHHDGPAWRAVRIESAQRSIEYHEKGWADAQERARKANEWVNALVDAVPPPEGSLR